jgi:hypothetical protein
LCNAWAANVGDDRLHPLDHRARPGGGLAHRGDLAVGGLAALDGKWRYSAPAETPARPAIAVTDAAA